MTSLAKMISVITVKYERRSAKILLHYIYFKIPIIKNKRRTNYSISKEMMDCLIIQREQYRVNDYLKRSKKIAMT